MSDRPSGGAELEGSHLDAFFDGAPVGMSLLDDRLRYVQINEVLAEINGLPVEDHFGKSVHEVVPKLAPTLAPLLGEILATGEPVLGAEISGELPSQPGVERDWLVSMFRVSGDTPGTWAIGSVVVEITERKKAEAALRRSEADLRALMEDNADGIVVVVDGEVVECNSAFLGLLDLPRERILGRTPGDFLLPEDVERVAKRIQATMDGNTMPPAEYELVAGDGGAVPVEIRSAPVTFQGRAGIVATMRDITERKQAEAHQKLLVRELDHRVKNTLAQIVGLIGVTARSAGSTESFVETVTSRVHAMARVHGALASESWGDIDIPGIVDTAVTDIAQFRDEGRLSVAGASWGVSSYVAMPLGQALHELAVNAVKHGSLSSADGRLDIGWDIEDDGTLVLRWTESGGPRVSQGSDSGVGLSLVTALIEDEIGGELSLNFPSTGARHELRIPRIHEP